MNVFSADAITVLMGFFAIMNPAANAAVFVGLTDGLGEDEKRRVARQALITAFIVVSVFCFLGKEIFDLFGITLQALRITGGVLIFLVGFQMLQGKQSKVHHPEPGEHPQAERVTENVALSPLAMPILAGPGTIANAMNYSAAGGISAIALTIASFAVICIITYFAFIYAPSLIRRTGENGLSVITRLMGLILAVIGTQMAIVGISGAFKLI